MSTSVIRCAGVLVCCMLCAVCCVLYVVCCVRSCRGAVLSIAAVMLLLASAHPLGCCWLYECGRSGRSKVAAYDAEGISYELESDEIRTCIQPFHSSVWSRLSGAPCSLDTGMSFHMNTAVRHAMKKRKKSRL